MSGGPFDRALARLLRLSQPEPLHWFLPRLFMHQMAMLDRRVLLDQRVIIPIAYAIAMIPGGSKVVYRDSEWTLSGCECSILKTLGDIMWHHYTPEPSCITVYLGTLPAHTEACIPYPLYGHQHFLGAPRGSALLPYETGLCVLFPIALRFNACSL